MRALVERLTMTEGIGELTAREGITTVQAVLRASHGQWMGTHLRNPDIWTNEDRSRIIVVVGLLGESWEHETCFLVEQGRARRLTEVRNTTEVTVGPTPGTVETTGPRGGGPATRKGPNGIRIDDSVAREVAGVLGESWTETEKVLHADRGRANSVLTAYYHIDGSITDIEVVRCLVRVDRRNAA